MIAGKARRMRLEYDQPCSIIVGLMKKCTIFILTITKIFILVTICGNVDHLFPVCAISSNSPISIRR